MWHPIVDPQILWSLVWIDPQKGTLILGNPHIYPKPYKTGVYSSRAESVGVQMQQRAGCHWQVKIPMFRCLITIFAPKVEG